MSLTDKINKQVEALAKSNTPPSNDYIRGFQKCAELVESLLNSTQNDAASVATESPSSTKAGNQNSLKEAEIEELAEKIWKQFTITEGWANASQIKSLAIAAMKEMYSIKQ